MEELDGLQMDSSPRVMVATSPTPGSVMVLHPPGNSFCIIEIMRARCALGSAQRSWAEYITSKSSCCSRVRDLQNTSNGTKVSCN